MRVFNIIFVVLFVIFAGLQYNDPDPYVWMPIYLYAATMCFYAARKQFYRKLYLLGIAVYLIYAGYLFVTKDGVIDWATQHHAENIAQKMSAEHAWIEETREFFGLVICIVVLGINYLYAGKQAKTAALGQ
ncbi:transmembrane 220 family protein [Chitinophaga dinghuensis]|nr:transmembrane 220 family protein [Chitinophaga dinghuensis]